MRVRTATACLATTIVLTCTGQAAATAATPSPAQAKGQQAKLTVAGYKSWLKHTKGTAGTLKAFTELPAAKQRKLVAYLQDPKVERAFLGKADGDIGKNKSTTRRYNKDVVFTTKVTSAKKTVKGKRVIELTSAATEFVYKIPVTRAATWLTYQTGKNGVITGKGQSTGHTLRNHNAAYKITAAKTTLRPEANMLDGFTRYNAAPLYKTAGGKTIGKFQVVTGLGDHAWQTELGRYGD